MPTSTCPYCGSDTFHAEALRADSPDMANPGRFSEIYGHWFNKCANCNQWSKHVDGRQEEMSARVRKPKAFSGAPA